jgi:hypothetical protein
VLLITNPRAETFGKVKVTREHHDVSPRLETGETLHG